MSISPYRKGAPIVNTNPHLALRKHSIRTLTPSDLRIVHGGDNGQTKDNGHHTATTPTRRKG